MERANKLRRLEQFQFRRTKAHCSASALAQILTDVKKHGLPELTDRVSMRQGRDEVATMMTSYGRMLKPMQVVDKHGTTVDLPMACPFSSVVYALEESDSFRSFFKHRLSLKPSSPEDPWTIVLYCDEVTPGNPLSTSNRRKFHAFYWSFIELGTEALSHEESWFILLTEFSTFVNDIQGGLSACFAAAIKAFFKDGLDMARGGITLSLDGQDTKLFAKLGSVLLDGGAHKYVWGARGDGASKFCLLCKNVWTSQSNIVAEDGSNLLRCDVITADGLEAATDNELRTNMRYLEQESTRVSPEAFKLLQQALGLTYHDRNVLIDRQLDSLLHPVHAYTHDWMHCLFVDGVANLTLYLAFEACITSGMDGVYNSFSNYLATWRFPARLHAHHLGDIFKDDRRQSHRDSHHIKCQASDLLTIMGPLVQFTKQVLQATGVAPLACLALLCLVDLTDLIVATARTAVAPPMLLEEVQRFLASFVAAFGFDWLTPKAHWLLHLPAQLQRFGRLLNCFCLERKHRVPKRYATELKNTAHCASASLLKESICHHFAVVKHAAFSYTVALVNKRPASKKTRKEIWKLFELDEDGSPIFVASVARFSPVALCSRSDVVLVVDGDGFRAGRLEANYEIHDCILSLIRPFTLVRRDPNSPLAVWEVVDGPSETFETKDILASVEYCEYPDGNVATILPLEFR